MKPEDLKRILPRASKAVIDLNSGLQDTESKCSVLNGALAKSKGKKESSGRVILRYTSYRQRLLDPDNLAGGTKFLTDALRYSGAIRGDTADQIDLRFSQKKVDTKAQEKTLIEIYAAD